MEASFPRSSSSKVTKAKSSNKSPAVPTSSLPAGLAALQISDLRGHHDGYLKYLEGKEAKARWIARKREEESLRPKQESAFSQASTANPRNLRCMLHPEKTSTAKRDEKKEEAPLDGSNFFGFALCMQDGRRCG